MTLTAVDGGSVIIVDGGLVVIAGPRGPQGEPGPAGDAGPPGQSVVATVEPTGANCAAGGVRLVSASGSAYACNGTPGQSVALVAEPAGTTCPAGGVRVSSSSGTSIVCNGTQGAQGASGAVGAKGDPGEPAPGGVLVFSADGGALGPAYAFSGGPGVSPVAPLSVLLAVQADGGSSKSLVWRLASSGGPTAQMPCHIFNSGSFYYSGPNCTGALAWLPGYLPGGFTCLLSLPPSGSVVHLVAVSSTTPSVVATVSSYWNPPESCINVSPFPYEVAPLDDLGDWPSAAGPLRMVPR